MNANELETAMQMVDRVADASTPTVETEAVDPMVTAFNALFDAFKPRIEEMIDQNLESAIQTALADFDLSDHSDEIMDVVNYNLEVEDIVEDAVIDELRNVLRQASIRIDI